MYRDLYRLCLREKGKVMEASIVFTGELEFDIDVSFILPEKSTRASPGYKGEVEIESISINGTQVDDDTFFNLVELFGEEIKQQVRDEYFQNDYFTD